MNGAGDVATGYAQFSARPARRAAVAFADIVGYTTLMSIDPERTHARWMELLFTALRPAANRRGSTVSKSTGDGIVADFPSADHALAWAQEVQAHVARTDRDDLPPLAFRIAIAVGDIEYTEEDVYGPCVNVAARLQEHAPPGGIVLTAEACAGLSAPPVLEDLGVLQLRNIVQPVRALAFAPAVPPRVPMRPPPTAHVSIAVMPFQDPGGHSDAAWFASGITEDIVLSLGSLRDLAVTARAATLAWTGRQLDPCVIGRILGVRYVVSGTVRRAPEQLRLRASLHATEDGECLWSERIEAPLAELFAVQDAIVARVVSGVAPRVRSAELQRALRTKPNSLTAYDLTLRGMYDLDMLQRDRFDAARRQLQLAMGNDPSFAMPVGWLARWHSFAFGQGWSDNPGHDLARWSELASRAIELDPQNPMGHAMLGHYRAYVMHDPVGALGSFDRALGICPSHAPATSMKSGALAYLGRGPEALQLAERALALSPHGPDQHYYRCYMGLAHLVCGNHQTAAQWLRMTLASSPAFNAAHRFLIAALHAQGKRAEARTVAADLMGQDPAFRLRDYAASRQPFVASDHAEQLLQALRDSGVPD